MLRLYHAYTARAVPAPRTSVPAVVQAKTVKVLMRWTGRTRRRRFAPVKRVIRATIALLSAAACGSNGPPLSMPGTFVYRDARCGILPNGVTCTDVGDGLAYQICASDHDCSGDAPFCRTLGLFQGGDFNCNG